MAATKGGATSKAPAAGKAAGKAPAASKAKVPNAPSKTGKPSGGGRGNAPAKKK